VFRRIASSLKSCNLIHQTIRRRSSVGIVTRLWSAQPRNWDPIFGSNRKGFASLHIQMSSGTNIVLSYRNRGLFSGGKTAGAWIWPFISLYCRDWELLELHLRSLMRLNGVVLITQRIILLRLTPKADIRIGWQVSRLASCCSGPCPDARRIWKGFGWNVEFTLNMRWRETHPHLPEIWTRHIKSYPCNRSWWPIGLWDVEAPTSSRQSFHSWRWSRQPYAPANSP
jgi:hypothetical protein